MKTPKQGNADAKAQSQEPVQSGDTGSAPAPAKQADAEGSETAPDAKAEAGAQPQTEESGKPESGWQGGFSLTAEQIADLEKLSYRADRDIAPVWVHHATRRDSYGERQIFPAGMEGFVRHKNGNAVFSIQDGYVAAVYGALAAKDHIGEDQVLVVG